MCERLYGVVGVFRTSTSNVFIIIIILSFRYFAVAQVTRSNLMRVYGIPEVATATVPQQDDERYAFIEM